MNRDLITCLSTFAQVDVLSQRSWYNDLPNGVNNIEITVSDKKGRISTRFNSLKVMLKAREIDRIYHYDYIFAATYETVVFSLGILFFPDINRFFLLHHNNLDGLQNNIKKQAFKSYIHRVNHLVFEDFIGKYLQEAFKVDSSKIRVLPHPLNACYPNLKTEKKYRCVGISTSNDNELISEIISLEDKTKQLLIENKHVILRSKDIQFDDGYLKVISGYLEDLEYNSYLSGAEVILLLFPETFRNRMSGTLIDALSADSIVYGTDIPIVRTFADRYPSICHVFHNLDELMAMICCKDNEIKSEEFMKFKSDHSFEKITFILKSIFKENK